MFIGEGPGQEEDLQGRPFVGKSGELLDEALRRAGLPREYVFITNVVKCRPPGNRNPSTKEMEACSPYLYAQIDAIRPELIVTLGKVAAEFLLKREVRITKENGHLDFWDDAVCMMTVYHPAYVLRTRRPEVKEAFFQAIQNAREIAYGVSTPAHACLHEEDPG
jgi:DNA polymerase